ncbi:hypothetical protein FQR65_LT18157 [Abscondita terminalis]|nr:hypothetical protein FQR65_LT18157 [Abscondita terminalis]
MNISQNLLRIHEDRPEFQPPPLQDETELPSTSNEETDFDENCTESNIEVVYLDEVVNGQSQVFDTPKSNWASYKSGDLQIPPTQCLKRPSQNGKAGVKRKMPNESASRRQPHSTVKTVSASNLYDKYEALVDNKLVNEDFLNRKAQLDMEYARREHELKVTLMNLDIELKKKQLEALKRKI